MIFSAPGGGRLNVTGSGQQINIVLEGLSGVLQTPFSVLTERFDAVSHVISAVTSQRHPLGKKIEECQG
jgi:hypothetical protein